MKGEEGRRRARSGRSVCGCVVNERGQSDLENGKAKAERQQTVDSPEKREGKEKRGDPLSHHKAADKAPMVVAVEGTSAALQLSSVDQCNLPKAHAQLIIVPFSALYSQP